MLNFIGCLVFLLFVGCHSQSQGLQFTLDSTPDTFYCGHLQCSLDVNQNDTYIFSVISLTIFSIEQPNTRVKLASVSPFDPEPHVEPNRVHDLNATGSMSRNHGNLTLALRNVTDCVSGSYLCEFDFVNSSGLPDMITKVVSPRDQNPRNVSQGEEILALIEELSDDIDRQFTELKSQNIDIEGKLTEMDGKLTELKSQYVAIETKLDQLLNNPFRPLGDGNSSSNTSQTQQPHLTQTQQPQVNGTDSCVRGAKYDQPREKFFLWGRVPALCDTETDGGGWVIIQRRTKGDVDFYRGWDDYKNGFGNPDTDYWLGNDNIHNLTSQGYNNLRVDMEYQGVNYSAEYSNFSVADEISNYKLTVDGFHGNVYDSLSYNSGMFFSTFDRDNDQYDSFNCAADLFHGAWWYTGCSSFSNLNGPWGALNSSGVSWYGIVDPGSVTSSEMKVRQV